MKRLLLISAFMLLIPAVSRGVDSPIFNLANAESGISAAVNEVPAPNSCPDDTAMTLEQVKQLYGAKNVCGVSCGNVWPRVNCTSVCGDSASCFHGYCIYN